MVEASGESDWALSSGLVSLPSTCGGVRQKGCIGDLELRLGVRATEGDLGVTGREVVTTEARELGEIIQAGGDEKVQDRALGKDCMKRRGRGRRGSCKGKKKGEGDKLKEAS